MTSKVVAGLMSGTSLDGISAAVVRFSEDDTRISAELLSFDHRPYAAEERARIEAAMQRGTAQEYCRLSVDMGGWLADAANKVLVQTSVPRDEVAAIASHGHTIWHEPGHSTWQLGDAATIAERTGCAVVSDFRARDVAAGGQGAPLVPMADITLFSSTEQWRALQNIGGIGNVSVVPPTNAEDAINGVRAFDTGPGVVIIDGVTRALYPHLSYDVDGKHAMAGRVFPEVVDELLRHPYFASEPPKSTGRELYTPEFISHFIARCKFLNASSDDIIATAVIFTAHAIADQYRRFLPEPVGDVVLSGGGAENPALVAAITRALAPLPVRRFSDIFFDGEAKEAVAFALLGYLHLTQRPGNVPRATGARGPRHLGVLTTAKIYP
ncbi:MAG: anhydro-N-acetylmuramic acid kinase [Phycisphaerae bacterium]|nr:anhydro-N-acetylmuramic acid kinase [Gemmatimonadaceae bacterium]